MRSKIRVRSLAHGRCSSLAEISTGGLCFGDTLGEDGGIFVSSILGSLSVTALQRNAMALVLKTLWGNQSLNLGSFGVRLLALTLWLDFTTDDKLADIVFLGEAKELADLGCALGTKTLGVDDVSEAGDIGVALLDDREGEDGEVHCDDAATDGFALALTGAAGSVAGVAIGEEKSNSSGMHDTLLHRETLLVVAAGDLEDVALELVANRVARNLCAHSLLHEDTQLSLIFDLDQLLAAVRRLCNCQCVFVDS